MRSILVILFNLCLLGSLSAQVTENYKQAEQFYKNDQLDSALFYAEKEYLNADSISDETRIGQSLLLMGNIHFKYDDIPSALRNYLQALKIKEKYTPDQNLIETHKQLAILYENWLIYNKSIIHYVKLRELSQSIGSINQEQVLLGLASNYYRNQQLEEAIGVNRELMQYYLDQNSWEGQSKTLEEIIKIYKELNQHKLALAENKNYLKLSQEQNDTSAHVIALNNQGVLLRQLNQLPAALGSFVKSAQLQNKFRNTINSTTLSNIGILYQNQGYYQQSLEHLILAKNKVANTKPLNTAELAGIHNLLSIVYLSSGDLDNAYQENEQSINLAKSTEAYELVQLSYKTRSNIFEQFNNHEQALAYFKKHSELKDSLNTIAQQLSRQELLKQFSADQTEKEISLIAIDREVANLRYRKDLLENEKLRQEQELQQSLLARERLEKDQTEKALLLAQKQLEQEKAQQQLELTRQALLAEQKDRQIESLENDQTQKALDLAQRNLEAEQKDRAIAQSEKAKAELQLDLNQKNFQLENQKQTAIKNFAIGFLLLTLIILGLLFRTSRIRSKANKVLGAQKQELESAVNNLQQTQAQLLQSEKMASLGQLTAGVAHEINNPINFITSSVEALKFDVNDLKQILEALLSIKPNQSPEVDRLIALSKELNVAFLKDEVSELIDNIEIGASRTHNIVKALRTYSRDNSEEFVSTNLHEGLDSSLIILNHKIKDKVIIEKNYGDLPNLHCSPSRINQVFMNILDNAIQAMDNGGKISIRTQHDPKLNLVKISIKDNGKGMTQETIKNAFNPFFTTKEVGAGTGLGLYISYNIIEQHNGSIEILSEPEAGAEFIIRLPVK